MAKKKALITGISGQDASYLAELLLEKDYEVFGMSRHSASRNFWRIEHLINDIEVVDGDLTDSSSLNHIIATVKPDEIYNLAAQSFVGLSWDQPMHTVDTTAVGVLRLLEAIKLVNKGIKFYQASSSEMFGKVLEVPQNEKTPFYPRSPYGVSKCFGHHITVNYRESFGLFAVSGMIFNHESPRRGKEFVTRKITDAVARIKLGAQKELRLGNLDSKRDWSHAKDMVYGMWLMMQQEKPKDYVLATGETHSIKEFVDLAFSLVGLDPQDHIVIDPKFVRPAEVDLLVGDYTKAKTELGWEPKISFEELVREMVESDLKIVKEELKL